MTELRFMRAFEDDRVNIIPADKETAHAILELPTHEVFTLTLKAGTRTSQQTEAFLAAGGTIKQVGSNANHAAGIEFVPDKRGVLVYADGRYSKRGVDPQVSRRHRS